MTPARRPMSSKVLVIEPYADLCAEIAATLRREHYVCDTAASAESAALELDQTAYAYVVGDVHTIAPLLATIDPASRVILLIEGESDDQRKYSTLRKPFGRDELIARFVH